MRMSSQLPVSSTAMTRTLAAAVIAIILVAANFTVINAQQPTGQQPLQASNDRIGLTATINGDSFTTGETITISGSVSQRGSSSNVVIEITDPQGELVKRGFPSLSAADNTFTYTFVAGELEKFDTNAPMLASGNYLVKVGYLPASGDLALEEVELSFDYSATSTPTSNSGSGAVQPTSVVTAPVTTNSSQQQAQIQNATNAAITPVALTSSRIFENVDDSFKLLVPQGWRIYDINNTGPVLSREAAQGYGMLAQLCPEDADSQVFTGSSANATTNAKV